MGCGVVIGRKRGQYSVSRANIYTHYPHSLLLTNFLPVYLPSHVPLFLIFFLFHIATPLESDSQVKQMVARASTEVCIPMSIDCNVCTYLLLRAWQWQQKSYRHWVAVGLQHECWVRQHVYPIQHVWVLSETAWVSDTAGAPLRWLNSFCIASVLMLRRSSFWFCSFFLKCLSCTPKKLAIALQARSLLCFSRSQAAMIIIICIL